MMQQGSLSYSQWEQRPQQQQMVLSKLGKLEIKLTWAKNRDKNKSEKEEEKRRTVKTKHRVKNTKNGE
jgi:hypothetical protein